VSAVVRPAVAEDAAALAELATLLGYPAGAIELARRLAGLGASNDDGVFVASDDALGVVGWIHVSLLRHLESDPYAEIVGLVVGEGARGAGVGAGLVDAARGWARERGLTRIDVRSNVVREDAHRFYVREGFREVKRQVVMTLRLG